MQCNAMQCNAIQSYPIQRNAIQRNVYIYVYIYMYIYICIYICTVCMYVCVCNVGMCGYSIVFIDNHILWGPTTLKPQNLYFWGPRNEPPNTGAERGSMKERCCTMWGHGSYLVNHLCKVQATWCACYFGWSLFQRICYFVASTIFSDPLQRFFIFFVAGAMWSSSCFILVAGAVFGELLHFLWRAQYLVNLQLHFSWQAQYLDLYFHVSWQAQGIWSARWPNVLRNPKEKRWNPTLWKS